MLTMRKRTEIGPDFSPDDARAQAIAVIGKLENSHIASFTKVY